MLSHFRLYDKGHTVHGNEFDTTAVKEFFQDFKIDFSATSLSSDITVYKVGNYLKSINIF